MTVAKSLVYAALDAIRRWLEMQPGERVRVPFCAWRGLLKLLDQIGTDETIILGSEIYDDVKGAHHGQSIQ